MSKAEINHRSKLYLRNIALTILAIALLFTGFLVADHIGRQRWENSVVATVNGEPVIVKEILPVISKHRTKVYKYFGIDDNLKQEDFWSKSFDGETPAEKLIEIALNESIRIKVQQILGRENGLMEDITYSSFLSDLEEENAFRREALKSGEVIYGPQQYQEDQYFSAKFSDMVFKLRKKIDDKLDVADEEISDYYKTAVARGKYKKYDSIKIDKFSVTFDVRDEGSKDTASQIAEGIKAKLENGESSSEIYQKYSRLPLEVKLTEQILDLESRRDDYSPSRYQFTEKVIDLEEGEVSEVVRLESSYYVAVCTERKDGGVFPLGEVDETIKEVLKKKKYREYVDELVDKAEVVVKEDVCQKLVEGKSWSSSLVWFHG